jgi:hypothetical protein
MTRSIQLLPGLAAALALAAPAAAAPPTWDLTEGAFDYGHGRFGEVLGYSANNSDGFQCHFEGARSHSGLVHVLWLLPGAHRQPHPDEGWPTTLTLASGSVTGRFKATASDDPDATPPGSVIMVEANLPLASPVMQAFGGTGAITLSAEHLTQSPQSATATVAARFVWLCSK